MHPFQVRSYYLIDLFAIKFPQVSKVKREESTGRVAPKPQKLNIPRADKEKLEDVDIEAMYER